MSRRLRRALCLGRRALRWVSMTCGRLAPGRRPALARPETAGSCGSGSAGRAMPGPETSAGRPPLPACLAASRSGRPARSGMMLCSWELTLMAAAGAAGQPMRRIGGLWKKPRAWCPACSGQGWRGMRVRSTWRIFLAAWRPLGGGRSRTLAFAKRWPRSLRVLRCHPPLWHPLPVGLPPVQPRCFSRDTAATCAWWCPGRRHAVPVTRSLLVGVWRFSGTRSARVYCLWTRCLHS